MTKELGKEFEAKTLKKESSPKATGAVFILLAILVTALGIMVHYLQIGGLPPDVIVDVLVQQLNLKFATDYFVGFFTGIFLVLGGVYLKKKGGEQTESTETTE